ncbi:hypothetical protein [Demequina iriomotensis]|uniref:hypothetical protein n=1 Tax=Demequina iriomotensis TaxID=1536641 RepID=UPI0007814D3D|nr:hypothetical protein [Demequina iriomotensis]
MSTATTSSDAAQQAPWDLGEPSAEERQAFETSEGLRALIVRLHAAGDGAWRDDPDAAALMAFCTRRYGRMARKHGCDPWIAAAAAFDAMRHSSMRTADDPWAMVTRAVKVTLVAEERANGLLCSVDQARRPQNSVFHDAERFSDREHPLADWHESLRVEAPDSDAGSIPDAVDRAHVGAAIADALTLLTHLGWPYESARRATECVCDRLADYETRMQAWESLRRDFHQRVLLNLSSESWNGLLRVLLGNPEPEHAHTRAGRGVLFRLLHEEPLVALLDDADLVIAIVASAPRRPGERRAS